MGRWEATPLYRGGSGEPLVVLHGGGATWRLWKPAIEFLEPHFEVLAPTLPGHWGGPELPPGPLAPCPRKPLPPPPPFPAMLLAMVSFISVTVPPLL